MLCHLPQKDATRVREAFTRRLAQISSELRLSLTYDQGKEIVPTPDSRRRARTEDLLLSSPQAPRNAAPAKARTVVSATIYPKAPTSPSSLINNSPLTKRCSTSAPVKSSTGNLQPNASTNLYQKIFTFILECANMKTS